MVAKYRMYVDEVGNPDLGSSGNPNHRYLSLTGVMIDLEYVSQTIHPEMEQLKSEFFASHPDDPLVLHRKELVNARWPFHHLRDAQVRQAFDSRLLSLLQQWRYCVVTVCIDKLYHRETYRVWRFEPYHYCMMILLERFVLYLEGLHAVGDVIAESRGGREDRRLKDSYSRLWLSGSDYISHQRFAACLTSRQLKVKLKSNNISGLQLADIIAHPSRSEVLLENGQLVKPLPPFAAKIVDVLQKKYYQRSGKVFGKKYIGEAPRKRKGP
jgi:hypothetical protein